MVSKLVRVASINSPSDTQDKHIGWTRFEDMPIPSQSSVLVDGVFYNVIGVTIEMTTGMTPTDPGEAVICLKVQRTGPILAASPSALDAIKLAGIPPTGTK